MKIRNGFVSNSSSSSFIMRVPEGTTEEERRELVEQQVGEMKGFFIPNFRNDLVDAIMKCSSYKNDYESDLEWEIKWIEEDPKRDTEKRDRLQTMADDEFDYYCGGFSDNGDGPIQAWLCYMNFKVSEERFFMENSGGY